MAAFAAGPAFAAGQGLGLISYEGPSGLFLNPTSGTIPEGKASLQYCVGVDVTVDSAWEYEHGVWHGLVAAYGVRDWLDAGMVFASWEGERGVGGYARARLLKDQDWRPELSVGVIGRFGDDEVRKQTVFVAMSKGVALASGLFLHEMRGHVGFRRVWQDDVHGADSGSIAYVGGELALWRKLYLVAEVSSEDELYERTPYSVGMQYRSPRGYGFSLAAVQTGYYEDPVAYIGVGLSY